MEGGSRVQTADRTSRQGRRGGATQLIRLFFALSGLDSALPLAGCQAGFEEIRSPERFCFILICMKLRLVVFLALALLATVASLAQTAPTRQVDLRARS